MTFGHALFQPLISLSEEGIYPQIFQPLISLSQLVVKRCFQPVNSLSHYLINTPSADLARFDNVLLSAKFHEALIKAYQEGHINCGRVCDLLPKLGGKGIEAVLSDPGVKSAVEGAVAGKEVDEDWLEEISRHVTEDSFSALLSDESLEKCSRKLLRAHRPVVYMAWLAKAAEEEILAEEGLEATDLANDASRVEGRIFSDEFYIELLKRDTAPAFSRGKRTLGGDGWRRGLTVECEVKRSREDTVIGNIAHPSDALFLLPFNGVAVFCACNLPLFVVI